MCFDDQTEICRKNFYREGKLPHLVYFVVDLLQQNELSLDDGIHRGEVREVVDGRLFRLRRRRNFFSYGNAVDEGEAWAGHAEQPRQPFEKHLVQLKSSIQRYITDKLLGCFGRR